MPTEWYTSEEQQEHINAELLILKGELEALHDKLLKQNNFYAAGYMQQGIAKLQDKLEKESDK